MVSSPKAELQAQGLRGTDRYCPMEAVKKHAGNLLTRRTILAVARSGSHQRAAPLGSCCQPAPPSHVSSTFPLAFSPFPELAPEGPSPKATFCSGHLLSVTTEACSLSLLSFSKVLDKTAVHVKTLAATPATLSFS